MKKTFLLILTISIGMMLMSCNRSENSDPQPQNPSISDVKSLLTNGSTGGTWSATPKSNIGVLYRTLFVLKDNGTVDFIYQYRPDDTDVFKYDAIDYVGNYTITEEDGQKYLNIKVLDVSLKIKLELVYDNIGTLSLRLTSDKSLESNTYGGESLFYFDQMPTYYIQTTR